MLRSLLVAGSPVSRRLVPMILVSSLAACAGGPENNVSVLGSETTCSDPRPEACTMEYLPVCARLESAGSRTYPNACGACADPEVVAHVPGACD